MQRLSGSAGRSIRPGRRRPSGAASAAIAAIAAIGFGSLSLLALLFLGCAAGTPRDGAPPPVERQGETPEWVSSGGKSRRYPDARFLTGFAMEVGGKPLDSARKHAAADLSQRISVRIEHELRDVSVEEDGVEHYKISAMVRSTSDIRVSDLRYETWEIRGDGDQHRGYALAVLERSGAVKRRRAMRGRSLEAVRACLDSGRRQQDAGQASEAIATFSGCRRPIAEALEHDAVVTAVLPSSGSRSPGDDEAARELMQASRQVDEHIAALLRRPNTSLRDAVDALAIQLGQQGISGRDAVVVAPLTYGNTDLSSNFGRHASMELEGAMARKARAEPRKAKLAVRGFYLEQGDELQLSATVRDAESGRMLASAESRLAMSAVPDSLEIKPSNFQQALQDQGMLAEGEIVSGDLRVELWTDRGKRSLLYTEQEELRIYFRVNQPCWVRLIYVLQNGVQVPIDTGFYVDASKVNLAIEYPETFEVVPPFGVEHIYAMAFTEEPPMLRTKQEWIDGQLYDIVAGGMDSVVRTRGIRRREKVEIAESYISLTTTPGD